jgi:UDP-N-acetylglucosamine 2-epimerase (non-hydrolysing)
MLTFLSVVGARPNFMKVAPLHRALLQHADRVRHVILHTGQHYDKKMSEVFFTDLELPKPDIYLGIGSGSHAEQTGRIMMEFERALLDVKPDLVIVVGDVNSTLACSVTCAKLGVPVVHVEAGLRSFDRRMPEEINRMVTDVLSDHLFVTEQAGIDNLSHEGVPDDKVHLVGDVMIDSLAYYRAKAATSGILNEFHVQPRAYTLVTLHRPSNVDVKENLEKVLDIFERIHASTTIIFPIHPRTRNRIKEFGLNARFDALDRLHICDPIGYLDFLCLMDNAQIVLTDSGGIQEETTYLQVPCLTLRENTERPITIDVGTNQLLGLDVPLVVEKAMEVYAGNPKQGRIPDQWDGHAAERIISILLSRYDR